jgi:arylsulfatase A-like enzyme
MARQQRERRGRPMFCHLSYVDPHDPYDPPEPYASRFAPGDMPRARPATWRHESFAAALEPSTHFQGFERIAEDAAVIARLRAYYHGSLAFLDDQIARIDRFLAEHDLWRDTIVVFTSDHGEQLGDHGLITKGIKPYDWGIRCPLVVVGRGVHAGSDDRLSCTLDLVPTMCDWAGIEAADRPPLEGRSAAPAARGEPDPQPWSAVSVAVGAVASVISDDGWRLTRWRGHEGGEMIDLRNDPNEVVNRYRDHGCSAKREDLLERLAEVLLRPGRVPQFRSMPRCDGRRHLLGGIGGSQLMPALADVRIGPSPAFDGGRDNAWRPGWSAASPGEVT